MYRNSNSSEKMCNFCIYEYVYMNVQIEINFNSMFKKGEILISIVFFILFDMWIPYLSIVKIYFFILF